MDVSRIIPSPRIKNYPIMSNEPHDSHEQPLSNPFAASSDDSDGHVGNLSGDHSGNSPDQPAIRTVPVPYDSRIDRQDRDAEASPADHPGGDSAPNTDQPAEKPRLLSLDALRGFDMIWILGATGIFPALHILTQWEFWKTLEHQCHHVPWHGFVAYDLIFPLFIFISGVTLGLSSRKMGDLTWRERGRRYRHAIFRLLLLIILGVIYNHAWGKGMPSDFSQIRYASVLGRIGCAWFIAALIVWHFRWKVQAAIAAIFLITSWALMMFYAVPGHGAGVLTPEGSLTAWIDQNFLPGIHHADKPYDPEGLFGILTASVNALLGALAGRWIMHREATGPRKAALLAAAGLALLLFGWLWHLHLPVNKELWTSSFVLVTCGWSALLLALFYWVIDVLGAPENRKMRWTRWLAFPLAVIGANALLAYLARSLIDWSYTNNSLFKQLIESTPPDWRDLLTVIGLLLVQWLPLLWLYKKRIRIRV